MDSGSQTRRALDATDVLGPLWRRRWLIALIVVASTAATYLISSQRADRYRATASLLAQNTTVQALLNQSLLTTPDRVLADQALTVASRPVAQRVIAGLGLRESADALREDVVAPVPLARGPGEFAPAFVDGFFVVPRLGAMEAE